MYIYIYSWKIWYPNFFLWEFFRAAYIGLLSLESKWQQVSSGLHDSSQYSDRSQQCCNLNGLNSSSDFQFLQSPLETVTSAPTTTGITVTIMFHSLFVCCCFFLVEGLFLFVCCFFFRSLVKSTYLMIFSLSFIFTLSSAGTANSSRRQVLFLFCCCCCCCWFARGLVFWTGLGDVVCISKPSRISLSLLLLLLTSKNYYSLQQSSIDIKLLLLLLLASKYYYYYYFYFIHLRIFPTSVSWWFSPGVWVTASLLKSPGFFSVFRPISTMLWSE